MTSSAKLVPANRTSRERQRPAEVSAKERMRIMAEQIKREVNIKTAEGVQKREVGAAASKAAGAKKRELADGGTRKGFDISALILVAVLLAAGAVLKMTVGSFVNFFGMKPNFIIAMYCLAILLVRPNLAQAGIIGLLTGAVCQLLPGSPYINFISEFLGALTMAALIRIPMKIGRANLQTIVATFISTLVSGSAFTVCLFLFLGASASSLLAYVPIVLCTALINCVIVQALYIPLVKVRKLDNATTAYQAS